MTHERLSGQDATLYCAQAPDAPLQIGALCLFEGGPLRDEAGALRLDDIRTRLGGRLDRLPRFRQRLVPVPFDLGRPVWEDDQDFDIAAHVRSMTVPAPGGPAELRALVTSFLETPLDEARPLWVLWLVEGIEDGRVAVILKASHVMADGMALLEFALTILDGDPDPDPTPPSRWAPAPPTAPVALAAGAVRDRVADLAGLAQGAARAVTEPRRVLDEATGLARATASMVGIAPRLPLTAGVGPRRDFAWFGLDLGALERVAHAHHVTLNDVVLTITSGGLRRYLAGSGVAVDEVRPRVLVPVSTHPTSHDEDTTNSFSFLTVTLPVAVDDPIEALREVHLETAAAKRLRQVEVASLLYRIVDVVPVGLLQAAGRVAVAHQPFVNLAVTNIPGTRDPLYLAGARLLDLYPFITVTGSIAAIVGVISYVDRLDVSVTVDADVVPDVDRFVAAVEAAAAALLDVASGSNPE